MTIDRTDVSRRPAMTERVTAAEAVDRLSRFGGPPEQFLANLLAVQCQIGSAEGGTILRAGKDQNAEIIAVYPGLEPNTPLPVWIAQSAELFRETLASATTAVKGIHGPGDMYGQPATRHLVMIPIRGQQTVRGIEAFLVVTRDAMSLTAARDRLELTASLLSLYEMRLLLQRRQVDLRRLRAAMETLAAINEHDRFAGVAMALCNELASRWQCDRVGLGFLKGRYVKLRAMSHTEKFSRKMKVIQNIEAAMEECLDQDVEIHYPSAPEATFVSRAASELSRVHGPLALLSLPLRHAGKPTAVLTLERPADRPFNLEEVEALRLTADLATPRLASLEEHDRWFGARMVLGMRKGIATVVSPKHTWIKAVVLAIVVFLLFAIFVEGTYRVEAPFVLEPVVQQVIPAPFDGFLSSVSVDPGSPVEGGKTVLATLETSELRLQLAAAKGEWAAYVKQAAAAASEDKTAEAQIAQAYADKTAAQMDLLEYQISHAQIISPITGQVTAGDLKRQIGAPVKTGEVLFEVAPLESLRAELAVADSDVADLEVGQEGELATTSYPERRVRFVVERINPMSEVADRQNVFKVRVRLDPETMYPGLRPGIEGLAKIDIGERRYIWIWTRTLINWIRMKLWL